VRSRRFSSTSSTSGSSPASWPGRWSIAIAVGTLIVAATLWWSTGRVASRTASVAPAPPVASMPTTAAARLAPLPPAATAVTPYPEGGTAGVTADDPLTAYRKANVYPPTSRPLSADQLDLLQPNTRHETERPADRGIGVSYLFTADRYFVIADETLTATLEVRHNGKPIPVKITQAYAAVLDPVTHADKQIPLTFTARGAALASTFVPSLLPLRRQTAFTVAIEFDHGSGTQRAQFDFQYTPKTGIPARFTGAFSDAVDAGSLIVRAGVEVASPGHYVIDANLFDAADRPVAWSRFKGELAAGTHDAELVFFGKVLVDAAARGPFHLGQLRGARYAPDEDPDLEQMPSMLAPSYATRAYPTDVFSDAEYDSADKQRMIELLGRESSHRGGAGRGDTTTPPAP
jgi:hypothetical protein